SGISPHRIEGAKLESSGRPLLIAVATRHVPAALAQGQAKGTSDEPGADHRGAPRTRAHGAGLLGQVIAQRLGPLEVDVVQLGSRSRRGQMHEDPDAALRSAVDIEFPGAQQWDVAEP